MIETLLDRTFYFETTHNGWQLARVIIGAEEDARNQAFAHTIKLLDLGKRYNVHLHKDKLKTFSEEIGTWCWHVHITAKNCKNFIHAH